MCRAAERRVLTVRHTHTHTNTTLNDTRQQQQQQRTVTTRRIVISCSSSSLLCLQGVLSVESVRTLHTTWLYDLVLTSPLPSHRIVSLCSPFILFYFILGTRVRDVTRKRTADSQIRAWLDCVAQPTFSCTHSTLVVCVCSSERTNE